MRGQECLLIVGLFVVAGPAPSQTPLPGQAPTAEVAMRDVETRLGSPVVIINRPLPDMQLLDEMEKSHIPGLSIAVIHGGTIQWAKGYGVKEQGGPPVTTDTLFQAGSISKSVAAMAALALVERGKLSLDAPINSQLMSWSLPENEFTAQHPVTLRELLSHTAGTSVGGFESYPRGEPLPTLKQILDGVPPANSPAVRVVLTPGTEFRYSGGGFEIVRQAMEDVTGKSFAEIARETVLVPAGMRSSSFEHPIASSRRGEVAYPVDARGNWIAGGPPTLPELAAGGLWTTPSDLARWIIELQKSLSGESGHVLSPAFARLMLTPVKENYGLGIQVNTSDRAISFYHGGANTGYQAMYVGMANGDGAVVMTSSDNGFAMIPQIISTLARIYNWPAFAPEKRLLADVPLAQQLPYIGSFTTKDGDTFKIASVDGRLQMSVPSDQRQFVLFPSSSRSFFVTEQTMQLTFDTPDHGTMQSGWPDGQKTLFDRISQPSP